MKNIIELNCVFLNEKIKPNLISIYNKLKELGPNIKPKGIIIILSIYGNINEILDDIDRFGKNKHSKLSLTSLEENSIEESIEDESSLKSKSKNKLNKEG